jgi:small subunit ribosomal protein S12e
MDGWINIDINFFCFNSMSDEEQVIIENQEVEVAAEAPAGQMSVEDALQEVLRRALVHDGLARGLKEAVKALDR